VSSAIQSEFSQRSTSAHTACHSGVPRGNYPLSWKKNPQDKQQQSQEDSSQQQKKKHGDKAHQANGSSKSVNDDEY